MAGLGWIAAIIVGGLAGWIASIIMRADTGIVANIIIGIVGAVVARFIGGFFNIYAQSGSWLAQGLSGLVGAIILIWLYRAIAR